MLFLGLSILFLYFELALSSNACLSQTPCNCILPNHTVIDLSTVGSPERPWFYSISFNTTCNATDLYSYNPCFPFNSPDKETVIESDHTPCIGASACVKGPGGIEGQLPEEHAIGLQNSANFGVNGSTYYINYTAPGSKKTLVVFLICDKNINKNKLTMVHPECSDSSEIVLNLTSRCACADGCQSSIPSPEHNNGLSTGSKILIAFFTILLAYLIIGVVWNYCNGSQGIELIPNIEFWNDLPTLIMEGIAFSCSCCISKSSYGEV